MKIPCNHHVASFTRKNANDDPRWQLPPEWLDLPAGDYTFHYDYPLSREAEFKHVLTERTTVIDILLLGAADYRTIYAEETDTEGIPGNIPGMLNRAPTNGKYGIWGHVLSDLYFEAIHINVNTKSINFGIGS